MKKLAVLAVLFYCSVDILLGQGVMGSGKGAVGRGSAAGRGSSEVYQRFGLDTAVGLVDRIRPTPPDVLKAFHEAGMSPREHRLSSDERLAVAAAFDALPPLHRRVLRAHLLSISFLDDMPNTALTSTVNYGDSFRLYHISFRAAILKQNISEWLTEKELTLYDTVRTGESVSVEAGTLGAISYVLLHEGTHVVDGSLGLMAGGLVATTAGAWTGRTDLDPAIADSLLERNHFRRGGRTFPIDMAPRLYASLQKTPFVSLYSTSSWSEDLAELVTVYHLTHVLKQPFRIVVRRDGREVMVYEPMGAPRVRERLGVLDIFYRYSFFEQSKAQ